MAETEVETTAAAEAAKATSSPCSHSLPFARTLTPGWAKDLRGKPLVHRPTLSFFKNTELNLGYAFLALQV